MSTLAEHFKSVADAIRAKKGTTDLIAPVDFAEEINNLPEGGETAEVVIGCILI